MMKGKKVAGIRKRLSGTEMQELKSARSGLSIHGARRTAPNFRTGEEEETKIFSHNYPTTDGEPKNSHSAPNYSPGRGSGEGAHHTAGCGRVARGGVLLGASLAVRDTRRAKWPFFPSTF